MFFKSTLKLAILPFFLISLNAQSSTPPPETSQFDFWVGEWTAEWKTPDGEMKQGSNTIRKILNDFVIEENFDGNPALPFVGKSHSVYSPVKKKWLQTWVDNSGGYLDFEGEFMDGKMTLARSFNSPKGLEIQQRMIFYNISDDSFDWNWEVSQDGGKTFTVNWKINYTRKK